MEESRGTPFVLFSGLTLILCLALPCAESMGQQQVYVDLTQEHQTMDGTGGNIYSFVINWSSSVLDKIINDINVSHLRMRCNVQEWEPYNDNSDPGKINWSAFYDSGNPHKDFLFLEKLIPTDIEVVLGIFDVPDWMVINPSAKEDRIIPPSMYPEFAELVVSYLLYAKYQYGFTINCISIQNEPNIGIYVYFAPDELAAVTEVVLAALDANGLGNVILHVGDVNEPSSGVTYYTDSLDVPAIAARTHAVSFHTWHNMTQSNLDAVRVFAEGRGVQTWSTEVGTSPLDSSTLDWALGSMVNHHMCFKYAHSSLTFQWCLAGAETSIDKYGNPYPVYYALKHYHQHINPGSSRVESSGDTGDLFTTGFTDKSDKTLSIVTINTSSSGKNVTYNLTAPGVEYSSVTVYKTTSSHKYQNVGTVSVQPNKTFSYNLDGRSFHTFTCKYSNGPDIEPPTVPQNLTVTSVTDLSVSLAWDPSSDNEYVAGYNVYEQGTKIDSTKDTYYTHGGLTPSTTYTYTVTAFDGAGNESGHSNPAKATTEAAIKPLGYWRLDEGSGMVAHDYSGAGFDGDIVGGAKWSFKGKIGKALVFDGQDDHINLGTIDIPGEQLTMAAWVKANSFTAYCDNRILSKSTGSSTDDHFWMLSTIESGGNTRLRFRLKTKGKTTTLIANSGNVPVDQWVHVAATYDGAVMRLYQNGAPVGQCAKSGAIAQNASVPALIGINANYYKPWDGLMDEVCIYDRTLSKGEIQTLMSQAETLKTNVSVISEKTGGVVWFTLEAGAAHAKRCYLLVGGMSGQWPGIVLPADGGVVPVNWDSFTNVVFMWLNTPYFYNFAGKLDQEGSGSAVMLMGPMPGCAGMSMQFAYALADPWDFTSNCAEVVVIP